MIYNTQVEYIGAHPPKDKGMEKQEVKMVNEVCMGCLFYNVAQNECSKLGCTMVRTPKYCTFRKDMQEERSYMQGYEALAEKNTREFLEEAAPASLESIKKLVTRR